MLFARHLKKRDPLLDRSTGCAARALVCRRDYAGNPAQQSDGSDFLSAFEYFRADPARSDLGLLYEYGQGVTKDLSNALELYQKSADQGNQAAIANLKRLSGH
jgi:TPR repeat protein